MHDAQQHDLLPAAAKSFVATAGVRKLDTILEAGAGLGSLTAALLATGATVHASEVDPERLATLRKRFTAEIAAGKLVVHGGDARRLAPALPADWRVVANPPFKLTSDLFRCWLLHDLHGGQPWGLDLILQYQAAQKLCGSTEVPGAHTRSSVIAHLFGEPRITKRLERTQVQPPSRVDLCGWSLRRRDDAPAAYELARIDAVLAVAFAGPRSVSEAMRGLATNVQLRRQAKEHGWDPDDHPRSLPPPAWRHLTEILARSGKLG